MERCNLASRIYQITRLVGIVVSLFVSISFLLSGGFLRAFENIVLLALFLRVSFLFQKKVKAVTPAYLFVFIILFLVDTVCSCYFTYNRIIDIDKTGFLGWGETDFYPLYFVGMTVTYIMIAFFLCALKERREIALPSTIGINQSAMYLSTLICWFLSRITGNNDFIIPIIVGWVLMIVMSKQRRLINVLVFVLIAFLFKDFFWSRYQFVEVLLPLVLAFLLVSKRNLRRIKISRVLAAIIVFVVAILLYGVVSEVMKLNFAYGMSYSLNEVLFSSDLLKRFFVSQIYRLFIVWIKLGGYIIFDTKINGFHYGLSYIKQLSGIFGFEYVSLPVISAQYNFSSYAQPGLFAEGYANFGIIGSVANLLLTFGLMMVIQSRYFKKVTFTNLLLLVVPFTKILVDGGTINSALMLMLPVGVFYITSRFFDKPVRTTTTNLRYHLMEI